MNNPDHAARVNTTETNQRFEINVDSVIQYIIEFKYRLVSNMQAYN